MVTLWAGFESHQPPHQFSLEKPDLSATLREESGKNSSMPTVATYLLPPPKWKPKGKPYPSSFKMTAEEAKARGAIAIVPGTTEERQEVRHQSAGRDGARS